AEIAETIIAIIDERTIRLKDLGTVKLSHKEREIVTRTDGRASVQLDIFKEADANIVALAKRITTAVGKLDIAGSEGSDARGSGANRPRGPPGTSQRNSGALAQELYDNEGIILSVVADRSTFIESSINEVRATAFYGGVLAVIVLFLFLRNVKSTFIIALSIPISLLVTFAPLNLLGVSLNIMSLGGLALGIGMLVDSSIVVLESIYRCREEGDDTVRATIRGTSDVRGAVVASILTTIGVFLPMVFVEGVAGQAFGDLGLAVVLSLLASLAVALFFIPMLASRRGVRLDGVDTDIGASRAELLRLSTWRSLRDDWRALRLPLRILLTPYLLIRFVLATLLEVTAKLLLLLLAGLLIAGKRVVQNILIPILWVLSWLPLRATEALLRASNRVYPSVLRWAINNTFAIFLITAGCVAIMYIAVIELDNELLPEVHQSEFTVEVALPVGTPLEETEAVLGPVEQAILAERDYIDSLIVTFGYDAENAQRSDEGEHTARFKVLLSNSDDNAATEDLVAGRIRSRLDSIPDLESRLVRPVLFSFRTAIEVEIYGDDLGQLRQLTERAKSEMAALPQLSDVEASLRRGAPEVQLIYDRDRLRRYGLNVAEVAERVRDEVKGREATRLNLKERRIPIVVRLDADDRRSVADIEELIVDPAGTQSIRLAAVAQVELGEGPSEIRRIDGNRASLIRANIAQGKALGEAVAAIEQRLTERIEWPRGTSFSIAGQSEEWERSQGSLWLALGLSVFLVYVIMAAQF
ncbi:MAG: efflux RND transporter permease subunit, partial [Myxococcota bacterium]